MIRRLPISLFTSVMGLAGAALAVHALEKFGQLPFHVSGYIAYGALAVFATIAVLFLAKLVMYPKAVAHDWNDPMHIAVFPAISIGMLLLSVALMPSTLVLSKLLWVCGASLHILFSLAVFHSWITKTHYEVIHMSPVWFIPVVGNILVPIAGVVYGPLELSWFYFAVGFLFWLVLLVLVFYRLVFHNPLPRAMAPTLFVLIAPPAVGSIAYLKLTASLDPFARILYYVAIFFLLINLTQVKSLLKTPFTLAWWAISFPLAALTTASCVMYSYTQLGVFLGFAFALGAVLVSLISFLLIRTFIFFIK